MAKKKVNKGGRPTKMTESVILKLEQAFAIGCPVEEACSYAEIARNTFYEYLKKNPKYQDRIDYLRDKPVLAARQRAVQGVKESYPNAMDYLKRKKRLEFGDSQDITSGGEKLGIVFDNSFNKDATTSSSKKDSKK